VAHTFRTVTQDKKINIRFIGWTILTWMSINLVLNFTGLFVKDWLSDEYEFSFDLYWHGKYIGYQTLTFALVFMVVYCVFRHRRIAIYSFVALQLIMFHIIFFSNLETYENRTRFSASWPSFDLTYLESNGQELVDIISIYDPMAGIFDCGIFSPKNTFRFYLVWIFLPLLYFLGICRLTEGIAEKKASKVGA
jgi:hypothetical protein